MKRCMASAMSILLAFSILGAAIGMPLTRHLCQMSQTLTVSVGAVEHLCGQPEQEACSEDGTAPVLNGSCCEFSITHEKAELQTQPKTESKVQLASPALLPMLQAFFAAPPVFVIQQKEALPLASDSSPPLAGRSLLAFISVLRI